MSNCRASVQLQFMKHIAHAQVCCQSAHERDAALEHVACPHGPPRIGPKAVPQRVVQLAPSAPTAPCCLHNRYCRK
eukprot:361231-Chlamydomonas_euryale.AAC.2